MGNENYQQPTQTSVAHLPGSSTTTLERSNSIGGSSVDSELLGADLRNTEDSKKALITLDQPPVPKSFHHSYKSNSYEKILHDLRVFLGTEVEGISTTFVEFLNKVYPHILTTIAARIEQTTPSNLTETKKDEIISLLKNPNTQIVNSTEKDLFQFLEVLSTDLEFLIAIGQKVKVEQAIQLLLTSALGAVNVLTMLPFAESNINNIFAAFAKYFPTWWPSPESTILAVLTNYLLAGVISINFFFGPATAIKFIRHLNKFYLEKFKNSSWQARVLWSFIEGIVWLIAAGSVLSWISLALGLPAAIIIGIFVAYFPTEILGSTGLKVPMVAFMEWIINPNRQMQIGRFILMLLSTAIVGWALFLPAMVAWNTDFGDSILNILKHFAAFTAWGFALIDGYDSAFGNDIPQFLAPFYKLSNYWYLIPLILLTPTFGANPASAAATLALAEGSDWGVDQFISAFVLSYSGAMVANAKMSTPTIEAFVKQINTVVLTNNPEIGKNTLIELLGKITTSEGAENIARIVNTLSPLKAAVDSEAQNLLGSNGKHYGTGNNAAPLSSAYKTKGMNS